MKKFVGRLLAGTDIYPAARAVYRKFNARSRKAREYELDFYRAIIKPGDLVFDIGANVGFKTEAFVACGARVICVEPNPKCLPILLHEFGSVENVTIVPKGVGAQTAIMHLNIMGLATTASMLDDWQAFGIGASGVKESVQVQVTTLDDLIDRFGEPAYIKIDVEGFELEVLKGLSRPVSLLSFEYGLSEHEAARMAICLDRLTEISPIQLNATANVEFGRPTFAFDDFIDLKQFDSSKFPIGGDCFVKMQIENAEQALSR